MNRPQTFAQLIDSEEFRTAHHIQAEGHRAAERGQFLHDNPHSTRVRRLAWARGWLNATSDYIAEVSV